MTTETVPEVRPIETRERTASDVLLAAARYIEEYGWWTGVGDQNDPDGTGPGACLMLSIDNVPGGESLGWDARARVMRVIGVKLYRDAYAWNDAPERTREEVLAALREAAR